MISPASHTLNVHTPYDGNTTRKQIEKEEKVSTIERQMRPRNKRTDGRRV